MVALPTAKTLITFIPIAIAVILFAFIIFIGLNPMMIALIILSMAIIAYAAYVISDRLLIAFANASTREVPAPLRSAIGQYCEQEHIPIPRIAIVHQNLPDVYIDGINKRKKVLMITSGAVSLLNEGELCDQAIRELASLNRYKAFDMMALRLVMIPAGKMHDVSLSHRYMPKEIKLAGQINEHVKLRRAEDKDFLRIYHMGVDAFRGSTEFIPLHVLAYLYQKPTAISIIAEYEGEPAGFIVGHMKQGAGGIYGHIDAIAVHGQQREKGIGMGLAAAFIKAMKECGCRQCCLEVWEHNEAAIKLYEKAGFVRRAIFENYYMKGKSALVMCKNLVEH